MDYGFQCRKTKFESFNRSDDSGGIDVNMDRSVLDQKSSFEMLVLSFLLEIGLEPLHCL